MATMYEDGERLSLGRNDTKILTALLRGDLSAYQIASQCQADDKSSRRISNGALNPALKRLEEMSLISRSNNGFIITPLGQELLGWEINRLSRLVKLARSRVR